MFLWWLMLALQLHYICIALLSIGKDGQALNDIVKHWLALVGIGEIRQTKRTNTKARARVYIARIKHFQLVSDNPNDAWLKYSVFLALLS